MQLPTKVLGKTGRKVTIFGLGGEGILRTTGYYKEAQAVIEKALEVGITYFDTAPAYQQSRDYLGEYLWKNAKREQIFLASKTHDRTYEGTMLLLEDSLRRLKAKLRHNLSCIKELERERIYRGNKKWKKGQEIQADKKRPEGNQNCHKKVLRFVL